jgi:hypothetical protein
MDRQTKPGKLLAQAKERVMEHLLLSPDLPAVTLSEAL